MYAIQTNQLTKSIGNHRGIDKLNLDRSAGRTIWFIGPNGPAIPLSAPLGLIKPNSGAPRS